MKTQKLKRMMSLFLAALICVTTLVGFGTTAYAAEETDEVCLVSFPRDGDANYGGEWGHGSFNFMNGWFAQTSRYTTVRAMGSYDGNICYCIEPGVPQESGDRYTKKGENFWDNYPSSYNHTISPDDIKLFIGRIFQYGYTGTISTSWRSQNEGGDKLAHAVATQLLVWETIVGERDADFNKVGTGGKDAICDQVSTGHPLYSQIMSYYNSIAASVQTHSKVPSFFAKSTGKAKNIELEWDGEKYTATLTDTNNVLSNYTFSASVSGIRFSVNGKKLVITADTAPSDTVRITAEKKNSQRRGVITWTDGVPYVQENCDLGLSDNCVIYGHHMNNGSMFADLCKYADEDFYRQHKTIRFDTLSDFGEYEIVAAFKTAAYSEQGFKYYHFVNADSAEDFDAYIAKCKELALYDTGVSAEYGDKLITLSTCEYSRQNGRMVVVAKQVIPPAVEVDGDET